MAALTEAVRQGKARYIGFSEWTPDADPRPRSPSPASASSPASRSTRSCGARPRRRCSRSAPDEGIGQIVWSPLAQGILTGKYLPGQPAAGRLAGRQRGPWASFIESA